MKTRQIGLSILGFVFCCLVAVCSESEGTFKDARDGRVYKTVKIGKQTWMAENLKYKPGSGSWAYNDDENNVEQYGRLYNWETAKTVCPAGWHLPSNEEWTALADFLGGSPVAGYKIRATTDWAYDGSSKKGTNESGFNALPAGIRSGGSFIILGLGSRFWTSTPAGSVLENAWASILGYGYDDLLLLGQPRTDGYSVRCVKD